MKVIAFQPQHAELYGIECAILIQGIKLGLELNENKDTHIHNGKVWMYNTVKEWHRIYPFMTESKIKRSIAKLQDMGVIEVAQLDRNKLNHTNWYTLTNRLGQIEPIEGYKMNQSNSANCTNLNNIKQDIINQQYKTNNKGDEREGIFNEVWKAYATVSTRQPGSKKDARTKFKRLTSDELELIRVHLPLYLKNHVAAAKTDYLPNFTTYLNQRRYEDEKMPYVDSQDEIDNWMR